jgi:hypothetical protein
MSVKQTIHLGFEIPSGEPVEIPLRNMVVTGVTQEAGKTTCLEALIERAGVRAVTFITKRGEQSFRGAHRIPPYFRERADWVFVSSLIDATMREKNKMIRAWLMKVCRNTRTLAEVLTNVKSAKGSARGFAESIYTEIEGYLELVVPQLKRLPPSHDLILSPGVNAVDLVDYSIELQSLVIRSVMEHVHEREREIITVTPEAWEFVPQGRNTPVTVSAREILRKGSGIGNRLWFDSQDLRGIDKEFVGQCPVVLMGYQREANEVKRSLANLHGLKKPKAHDVAALSLGQFFASWGSELKKVYVQPAWMSASDARAIARGEKNIDDVPGPKATHAPAPARHLPEQQKSQTGEREMSDSTDKKLDQLIELMKLNTSGNGHVPPPPPETAPRRVAAPVQAMAEDEDALYQRFKARLVEEAPAMVAVLIKQPEIAVKVEIERVDMGGKSLDGRVALLIHRGFMDAERKTGEVYAELKRTGPETNNKSLSNTLADFVRMGFLTREGKSYKAVAGMKRNIV